MVGRIIIFGKMPLPSNFNITHGSTLCQGKVTFATFSRWDAKKWQILSRSELFIYISTKITHFGTKNYRLSKLDFQ